jgi:hypothetical protein
VLDNQHLAGFEPAYKSFADSGLTTWRKVRNVRLLLLAVFSFRIGRELATRAAHGSAVTIPPFTVTIRFSHQWDLTIGQLLPIGCFLYRKW